MRSAYRKIGAIRSRLRNSGVLQTGGSVATGTTHSVSVADSVDPVITGGDAFSYTVQYTNTGSIAAANVSVAVTVDSSLTITGSSGTGWSISTAGQVVTCTQASVAVGAANPITINVTTGASAVSASTSAQATADNATTANGSQGTTVSLVTRDATAGRYVPASATEWSAFRTRKGLTAASPDSLWNAQEASGNLADSIGALTLTAAGTPSYQQTVTGWSRKAVTFTDNSASSFLAGAGVGPNPATTSQTWMFIVSFPATPASTRNGGGINVGNTSTAPCRFQMPNTGKLRFNVMAATVDTVNVHTGAVHVLIIKYDRGNSAAVMYTDLEKLVGTYSGSVVDGGKGIGGVTASPALGTLYVAMWSGTNAQIADADVKALLQAMGYTISWS